MLPYNRTSSTMHYRPCVQYQNMLIEQHQYYRYPPNYSSNDYSSSDHQEEETDYTGDEMPSETSGNQSPNTDMFRLAFAASQSSKLVVNAEKLLKSLLNNEANVMKTQIEQWLCMKEEYEECIAGDDSGSLQDYNESFHDTKKSLEMIEEVTETDEKTDESNYCKTMQNRNKKCSDLESESESETESDEEERSDTESEHEDFLDRLDEYMKRFKEDTDRIVSLQKNDFVKLKDSSPVPVRVMTDVHNYTTPIVKPSPVRNQYSRRTSIIPFSEMSDELAAFQKQNCDLQLDSNDHYNVNHSLNLDYNRKIDGEKMFEKEAAQGIVKTEEVTGDPQKVSALEKLITSYEAKQNQLKQIQTNLDIAYNELRDQGNIIQVQEQFMKDISKDKNTKEKVEEVESQLVEKYSEAKSMIKLIKYTKNSRDGTDELVNEQYMEKYENLKRKYGKDLSNLKNMKKVEHVENLLKKSKKQVEKLKCQINRESEHKLSLENKLIVGRKEIKEFSRRYNITNSRVKEILSEDENAKDQRDLKVKSSDEDEDLGGEEEENACGNLCELEKVQTVDKFDRRGTLRQEIIKLRNEKERLTTYMRKNKKFKQNGKIFMTPENQRDFFYICEKIAVIDSIIEHKNVMMCSSESRKYTEQKPILSRLGNLSHDELVILFDKYFHKVVDLKDTTRTLEFQCVDLEKMLKRQRESEQQLIEHQNDYEQNIDKLIVSCYPGEASALNYDGDRSKNKYSQLVQENQALRQQLALYHPLLKSPRTHNANDSNARKLHHQLLEQVPMKSSNTHILRGKNKITYIDTNVYKCDNVH